MKERIMEKENRGYVRPQMDLLKLGTEELSVLTVSGLDLENQNDPDTEDVVDWGNIW